MQTFGYSSELHFTTGPVVGPNSTINIIFWADSGHAIADGSWEWEWCALTPLLYSCMYVDMSYGACQIHELCVVLAGVTMILS